jgi:hypothetical protein
MTSITGVKLVNLTPHEVVVFDANNNVIAKIPPSGTVARVVTREKIVGSINGIPVVATEYGDIDSLPDPQPNTVYIVSLLVLQALQARGERRSDVVAPNTAPTPLGAVRDSQGRIIGVRSFVTL